MHEKKSRHQWRFPDAVVLQWQVATPADSRLIICRPAVLQTAGKMESQWVLRDLRSGGSVLWWEHLNCLLIYNYVAVRLFGFTASVNVHASVSVCTCEVHISILDLECLKCPLCKPSAMQALPCNIISPNAHWVRKDVTGRKAVKARLLQQRKRLISSSS